MPRHFDDQGRPVERFDAVKTARDIEPHAEGLTVDEIADDLMRNRDEILGEWPGDREPQRSKRSSS